MSIPEALTGLVEAALWYAFLYLLLDAILHKHNLWLADLYLLVTAYLAFVACPCPRNQVRNTRAWERLF